MHKQAVLLDVVVTVANDAMLVWIFVDRLSSIYCMSSDDALLLVLTGRL